MKQIKLFVVAGPALLGDIGSGELCLVMLREGILRQYNEAGIIRHETLGQFKPPLSCNNIRNENDPKDVLLRGAEYLGKDFVKILWDEMRFSSLKCFTLNIFGVYIPNALDVIETSPRYGTIDLLDREHIERLKKQIARRKKERPRKMTAKKIEKLRGPIASLPKRVLMKMTFGLSPCDIDEGDLECADLVLSYFQRKENERRARIKPVMYAKQKP